MQKILERFFDKVEIVGDCWLWQGSISDGYGKFWVDGKSVRAHRWYYINLYREINDDEVLDHLCRNRNCVYPHHLEPVSVRENTIRGFKARKDEASETSQRKGNGP